MKGIIRSIFRGNFEVLERPYQISGTYAHAFSQMDDLTMELQKRLPEEYHVLLTEYQDAMMRLMDASCAEDFAAGYQLGVHMMIAAWPEEIQHIYS